MRIGTSQTSPSFFRRHLLQRMLPFFGLIVLGAFALNTVDVPFGATTTSEKQILSSTDAESVDVREQGAGDSNNLEDNELRGQSPRVATGSRAATTPSDHDLFQSRSKERVRDDGSQRPLFQRKSISQDDGDPLMEKDDPSFSDDPRLQRNRTNPAGTRSREDRAEPPAPPVPDDDWSFTPSSTRGNGAEQPINPRQPSSSQPILPAYEDSDPVDDGRINDSRKRNDSYIPGVDDRRTIPRDRTRDDGLDSQDDLFSDRGRSPAIDKGLYPKNNPFSDDRPTSSPLIDDLPANDAPKRNKRRSNNYGPQSNHDSPANDSPRYDDDVPTNYDSPKDAPYPSNDRRRNRDLFLPPSPDNQPQYDDLDSATIDKRYLDVVKDNTVGVRRDEADVFYWLLDKARRLSTAVLERAGEREVQYINLMTEPDLFRGEPITIEGDLWRLYEFEAGRNRYGVTRVYEGWVFTGDSGNNPYRIVCTSLPKGVEPGENLRIPVRITGYFFKRESYKSNGGIHFAPTLIARRIGMNPRPNGIMLTSGIMPYIIGAIVAVGLALLVTITSVAVSDERSQRVGRQRKLSHAIPSFINLDFTTHMTVEESLRQLANRDFAVSGAYGPLFSRSAAREHAVHDYSTSHRIAGDDVPSRQRKQTGVLRTWTARQQAAQAEIDALRQANEQRSFDVSPDIDELGSGRFETARNLLTKPMYTEHAASSLVEPIPSTPLRPTTSHHSVGSALAVPIAQKILDSGTHTVSPSIIMPAIDQSNISYSASKLSEWEEEIARMKNRSLKHDVPKQAITNSAEVSVAAQIERDRQERERETRERIKRERLESERLHSEQLEHDRLDRERHEHERHEHERLEHERRHSDHNRTAFDRIDHDHTTFTLASSSPSGHPDSDWDRSERERLEYDRQHVGHSVDDAYESDILESDILNSDLTGEDSESGDNSGKRSSSSGWGRNKKRRRNWRDGSST